MKQFARAASWLLSALGQVLLLSVAVVPAWTFGGVLARDQVWLFPAVLAAVACWSLQRLLQRGSPLVIPWAAGILLLALALGTLQLVPLAPRAIAVLSPGAQRLRAELLPASSAALPARASAGNLAPPRPLSLEAAATRNDLALLALIALAFVLGGLLFSGRGSRLTLCIVVALQGGAVACYSLMHTVFWHAGFSNAAWRMAKTSASWWGPFVNRNHEGGYLNLCLAGVIALVVLAGGRAGSRSLAGGNRPPHPAGLLLRTLRELRPTLLMALALAGCIMAAICCGLSRGAMLSMAAALGILLLAELRLRHRRLRLWSLLFAVLIGGGLVIWLGSSETVEQRLGSLLQPDSWGRLEHWRDALRAVPDFWPLGAGLGTYQRAYLPYEHSLHIYWYHHAENQPLEALVVGGVAGLLLLAAALVATARAAWRALEHSSGGAHAAFAVGALFALGTQAVHSLGDFGLYMPANALLLALWTGAVSAGIPAAAAQVAPPKRQGLRSATGVLLLVILAAAAAWGFRETRRVAAVEAASRRIRPVLAASTPSVKETSQAVAQFAVALAERPDDAQAQLHMALLYAQLYRARVLEQLRREYPAQKADQLDPLATLLNFYYRGQELLRQGNAAALARLRNQPILRDNLLLVEQHALAAREACPLIPEAHLMLAELSVLHPGDDPAVHLRRAMQVAHSNGDLWNRCACLELCAGHVASACAIWKQSLAIDDSRVNNALAMCRNRLTAQQIVDQVLPDSPAVLVRVAKAHWQQEGQATFCRLLLQRARQLLARLPMPTAQHDYLLAAIDALENQDAAAVAGYQQALAQRPREIAWRFELAEILLRQGELDRALDEVRLCVAVDPANPSYRKLLEEILERRFRRGGERAPATPPH